MNLATALKLGRISNLPTVWTNVGVGVALSGGALALGPFAALVVALSLFYVGGMFLNDAYDREFDSRHRPDRPIPSGQVSAVQVFGFGYGMLAIGLAIVTGVAWSAVGPAVWRAVISGAALGGAIVLYDAWHKQNPLSPLVMGSCRVLVYVTAAVSVTGSLGANVPWAAGALLCHLIGVTYLAKQEHLDRVGSLWPLGFLGAPLVYGASLAPEHTLALFYVAVLAAIDAFALHRFRRRGRGDVPRAVITLLAGICVLDAMALAGHGFSALSVLAFAGFGLTLALQRWVAGT
jgi:hypothetical protein